jgi:nitrogen fixation protein NifU and related proteins
MRNRELKRKSDQWMDLYKRKDPEEMEPELAHGPILYYNELVLDHCTNPRNVGEIANADGYAHIGDPECGDQMQLWIKVDSDRISDIKFKSTGCAGAIATSSMTTVLAKGKTLKEAKRISDDHVVSALHGVSRQDGACSLSGITALREAIRNYEHTCLQRANSQSSS